MIKDKKMDKKIILLILGIIFDGIGLLSYVFPLVFEVLDFVWAPMSALAMFLMYKGEKGAMFGVIGGFIEEALPFTDFIPSFTLMWVYTYFIQKDDELEGVK